MKGSEAKMTGFMEGADKRYVIPVYQRKYDWKYENCRQLYDDLKKIVIDGRDSHFFGSIVSAIVPNGSKIEYHIIDGQQRLTTITLLLLAIRNLISQGKVKTDEEKLDEQISQRFLISPWASEDDRIKLRPIKSDKEALIKLFGDKEDYDLSSNLTINYQFFYDMVMKEEVSVADLYAAIGKLEIISITLDQGDNAQLIFESLNSTGLALTEGDKIRNYVLMGLPAQHQTKYYDTYWAKIEKCTANDVSGFVRDYLSIKQQVTPTVSNVYRAFKNYAESVSLPIDTLLTDLLRYARFFEKLLTCKSGLKEQKLDDCLYRLMRLEIVVTRPFLMEVLRLHQDGKLTTDDVLRIFLITENYLFRRNICEVPTNALNKIFLNLNKEIIRYDNTADDYVSKFIYALLSKKESGRFPDDDEFGLALTEKQVYQMRGKYKAYLFERFENYGTIETKDVYTHLDNNIYTIEHIMPQHLTPAWNESLGVNAAEIHATWLHRLANLTLTGYNPNLSNNTFVEKRDAKEGGYKASGLKMNQKIATKQTWGLDELKERNDEMLELAMEIWACPTTNFVPSEKEFDSCTLDDENFDLTGRDIAKYSYLTTEQSVTSWTDMFEHIVKFLHQKDKSVLMSLAYSKKENTDLAVYVTNNESDLRSALKIDENLYIEKNTSTALKMSILRRIFALYEADPMDLVFYLKDSEMKKVSDAGRHEIRRRYWEYALPIIQEQHVHRGTFSGCNPTTSNTESGFFGISGFCISCIANYDNARIDFYLGNGDTNKNKQAFDLLYKHKNEIEAKLGIELAWDRADNNKASWMCYHLNGVSITNEADWSRMAKFHAEWSDKICGVMLEYLLSDEEKRYNAIVSIFREWVKSRTETHLDMIRCNRTYTRFTTDGMSAILPDIPDAPSGWNTNNHYFYEIINRNGKTSYIQLAISSKNITDEFRAICDDINKYYPAKMGKEDWQWRIPFKTTTIDFDEQLDKAEVFTKLDLCWQEILAFEADLAKKLGK
ncbi:DUF4268 domain-containing protein [Longicatena caecimuris]|uniref:Uncharacterized protein with ParB-like and HNH nuclease domain n=1 Tax=Longicatena caecimuris TaxID=1796635 RepID=A0A4R3TLP7_9FIRM|nr:DUF4268 domain-containing protein [Longicatena caecimuris]MCR1869790.1 DUF4268 domain-containing protein [Longicatena caecimuris]MCU0102767.1 DUF4268 domain-containing protein [Longicatena caecimuris]TCU62214.1 uncharacterized protein with ParB-like and HNH nuclease domain [Longicatena caecimuris]